VFVMLVCAPRRNHTEDFHPVLLSCEKRNEEANACGDCGRAISIRTRGFESEMPGLCPDREEKSKDKAEMARSIGSTFTIWRTRSVRLAARLLPQCRSAEGSAHLPSRCGYEVEEDFKEARSGSRVCTERSRLPIVTSLVEVDLKRRMATGCNMCMHNIFSHLEPRSE
jgi:hypothetical protein